MSLAQYIGLEQVQKVLKALKPDELRGSNLKLVSARPKLFFCPVDSCNARIAKRMK